MEQQVREGVSIMDRSSAIILGFVCASIGFVGGAAFMAFVEAVARAM